MADMKEKLVELIDGCRAMEGYGIDLVEKQADYLIANGVTIATDNNVGCKWISVKDRLPEHGDVVLCFMKFGEQRILQWDNVSNWWLGYGCGDDWRKADVTHWWCLPQPPKGE